MTPTSSQRPSDLRSTRHENGVVETTLPNGMRILVKPMPDDPLVTSMIWYAVGSRDEDVGETGLSHYLEHMMFKGTDRRPPGTIDKETQRGGGTNNASTRNDATEYHFSFPADRWEVPLDIEADRMRGSNVQQKEFDAEKNVVLQELRRNLDDPEDVLSEAVNSAVFRANRYHHPVIGWPEDVETTTRERMRKYYLKHYTPDRATLVVVGGVDADAVIARSAELFSPIPKGDVVRFEQKEPPPLGETRLTLRQDTQVPRLMIAFRTLRTLDPREPLLDVASSILAGDKTSRLDKRLVQTGIAASVSTANDSRRDDGLFWVQAEPTEGHTVEECENVIRAELAAFCKDGPTQAELDLARAKLLADQVYAQESAMGYASRIGAAAVLGDWQYVVRYPKTIEAATTESVRDVCKAFLDPRLATVGRGIPKDEGDAPAAGAEGSGGAGEAPKRAPSGTEKGARGACGRGGAGAPGAAPATSSIDRALDLKPLRVVLDDGLVVLALRRANAPVFSARLEVRDGRIGEKVAGLNEMTGALLEEGTTKRDGEAVAAAIGAVGGSYSADGGGVSVKTLSKDAQTALDLMAEVATTPRFAAEDVEKVRARQIQGIARELDTPRAVAQAKFNAAIYGETSPLGRSALGTVDAVKAITRDEVVAHHGEFWVPRNAVLAIVSDRDPQEMVEAAKRAFGAWPDAPKPKVDLPVPPAPAAKVVHVEMPREQTNTYLGHVGIVRTDPDYAALEVMDNVLGTGAGFTDRLSKNIRDEKGLAYTVFGNMTGNSARWPGTFRVYAGTRPEDAARALAEMRKEVQGILERPPTEDELAGAKAAMRGGMIDRCETASDVVGVLQLCERYSLGFDYPRRYLQQVEAVTAADVTRVAKAHVHPDAMVEVVVGPAPKPAEKTPAK